MVYSPTPTPHTQLRRQSATPPFMTKRDKRRNAMEARIKEMKVDFTNRREAYSRAQLNALSRDIAFINRADPYDTKPLDDYSDDTGAELTVYGGGDANGALRVGLVGISETEARPSLGKWAAQFVDSVNDTTELRDTELTEVVNRFHAKIMALQEEHDFAMAVAIEEHKTMRQSIRERAINLVNTKKKQLEKEKGLLDIADSNTLLLHPSQFTITQPASPGGAQSNRRTRHTRHRLDVETPETNGDGSKRKRKAPADFDNVSPGPIGRGSIDADAPYPYDRNYATPDQNPPPLSINNLFGVKDLQLHLKAAIETVGQSWSKRSKTSPNSQQLASDSTHTISGNALENGSGSGIPNSTTAVTQPDEEPEPSNDAIALSAPAMERGGSYATRSTRKDDTALAHLHEAFDGSHREAVQCFGYQAIGAHQRMIKTKDDIPMTSGLSAQEMAEDFALFQAAMEERVF